MKDLRKHISNPLVLMIGLAIIIVVLIILTNILDSNDQSPPKDGTDTKIGDIDLKDIEIIDDWQYNPNQDYDENLIHSSPTSFSSPTSINTTSSLASTDSVSSASTLGFSVGGSKDIDNFRANIEAGYLPAGSDLSHEGIFYDYFFETNLSNQDCKDYLFCPSYATVISEDPFSQEDEHFLAVGLNSNIKAEDFKRKKLNLVIVLDISGSMGSAFDNYYYDQYSQNTVLDLLLSRNEDSVEPRSKLEIASDSINSLIGHLNPENRLGIVLFDNQAYLGKDLRLIAGTDLDALKEHIDNLRPQGGTNMEAGYELATSLFEDYKDIDSSEYENRIIFLTDAMPNVGATNEYELANLTQTNADQGIYSTLIGIGIDFNSQLTSTITQVRGANYYSTHNQQQFAERLDEGFEYMVTPLVFDLNLRLQSDGYKIKAVYGSPEADLTTGEIMKVNTLFPSLTTDNQTKGGLILLHLEKLNNTDDHQLNLEVNYLDRSGKQESSQATIEFDNSKNESVQKGIILARLVNVLQNWIKYEEAVADSDNYIDNHPTIEDYRQLGIPIIDIPQPLNRWERQSTNLTVSTEYELILENFKNYFERTSSNIDDETLQQELEMLNNILNHKNSN